MTVTVLGLNQLHLKVYLQHGKLSLHYKSVCFRPTYGSAGCAEAKQVADFILRLGQIFTVGHAEKVIKIGQQLPKLYGKCYIGAPLLTRSFTCTMHLVT